MSRIQDVRVVELDPMAVSVSSGRGRKSENVPEDTRERAHKTGRDFQANLSAHRVDQELRRSLAVLQRAEKAAVLWFAEIADRKLYLDLGYSSIHQYASEALGFSSNKTYRFLRLTADLQRLPRLRESVATGELGWTKAREVAKVASAVTEERWIAAAKKTSRRDLERKVVVARQRAAAKRKANPLQGKLGASAASAAPEERRGNRTGTDDPFVDDCLAEDPASNELVADGPTSVVLRFTPMELARYEALIEKAHKNHRVNPGARREEIMLSALDALIEPVAESSVCKGDPTGDERAERRDRDDEMESERSAKRSPGRTNMLGIRKCKPVAKSRPRGNSASNYRIVIYQCSTCQAAITRTDHGPKRIGATDIEAIRCDATIEERGRRTRSTTPPSVRSRVLARDQHRCQTPGCKRTRFLEVHHIHPVARGGSDRLENLTTLCSGCHRLRHSRTDSANQPAAILQ
ncbi:HNH endonuclease [Candidatus Eisenbacteria bacterium]|uniref:HNH endonuclease n=1 Tax=Eiseniibacteriota bacterium TaxID=2212470 RepID=A0ABV6YKB3_UNCEI